MQENISIERERAILVGVIHGSIDETVLHEHLDELSLLADTAGAEIVGRITQRLSRINPAYFVGKGKAEQIVRQAQELDVGLILFDEDLSPAQTKNFQELSDQLKVIDRSALILDIFRQHARTMEAKTQVELAHLQYILPRLTRMWTHLERQMGGIGTRAGAGETQIEVDRRLIRDKIAKLKKELIRIDKERETQSKRRQKVFRVSLVGYTNAGKSTLMQSITGADVFIQDQLFATLDTTICSVKIDESHEIVLSDTVGFIRKLPHHLVASFRSTLREVVDANLILIVLDINSVQVTDHYRTILSVLKDLEAHRQRALVVLNKVDLVEDQHRLNQIRRDFPEGIFVSAQKRLRIDHLLERIREIMDENYRTVELHIPFEQGREIAAAQEGVDVLEREYNDTGIRLKVRGDIRRIEQIMNTREKTIEQKQ